MNYPKIYAGPVCKGSWFLGTNCGTCERCADTKADWISAGAPRVDLSADQVGPPVTPPTDHEIAAVCASVIRYMVAACRGDAASVISLCDMVLGGVVFMTVKNGMDEQGIDLIAANAKARLADARKAAAELDLAKAQIKPGQSPN